MKKILYILLFISVTVFSQEELEPQDQKYIYKGNKELKKNEFVNAEAAYRNAISENPTNSVPKYNLGNAYYKNNKTNEALVRYNEAQKNANNKLDKHKAFHNMGNSFMKQKKYDLAIEAYKSALRNNPKDNESRYNLALAKKKKEEQDKQDEKNKDKNKDNKDNKDKKDDKNKNDKDSDKKDDKGEEDKKKDQNDKDDKKEKDKKEDDKGKEDDKKDKQKDKKENKPGKDDKNEDKPKPQKGQLSPQQIQGLLEAMNNQEKKLQEKMNAKKQKGVPVKNEKDW